MRNHAKTLAVVGVVVLVLSAGSVRAGVLTFQEGVSPDASYTADSTTIRTDRATPQDDDPQHENLVGRVAGASMRGLWEFDLAALQAQGGFVQDVDLRMTTLGGEGASAITVNLFAYDSPFVESAATWADPDGDGNPATGDATPGGTLGNYLTSVRLTPTAPGVTAAFQSTPDFRAAIDAALASPDGSLRVIARRDVESGTGNHFVRFYDETQTPVAQRPELVITTGDQPMPTVVILDDGPKSAVNPDVALSGTWNYRPEFGTSNKPNSYNGTGSRFALAAASDEATYTPDLPSAGSYQVALWWPTFDWSNDTKVRINHAGGITDLTVDQSTNDGQWNALGVFQFDAGPVGNVQILSAGTTPGSSGVGPVADAVRFVLDPILPVTAVAAYASSVHPINSNRDPIRVIDGSGLHDVDDDPAADVHDANQYGDNINWMSNDLATDTDPWFAIDLGEPVPFLDRMEVFNFNASGAGVTNRGVDQADIYISTLDDVGIGSPDFTDTVVWQLLAEDVLFNEATGSSTYATPDVIDLGLSTARWIALDIDSGLGGSFVGLSEIQVFQAVPEPATLLLALLALPRMLRRRAPR